MARDLTRLLRPRSIAVVGGGFWGTNVVAQCQKIGFGGAVWPVHPTRREIAGIAAYPDVASLPHAPDATFIGVNREASIDVVADLVRIGGGGAVCFASGFLEADGELGDGAAKQAALLAAAGDMPIIGPNCYGFINYLDGAALWPDQHGGIAVDRGVALITQSSNIAINLTMQTRGLPIAYAVTVGNQAQIGMSEIGQALLADDRVTAVGLHIEGIDDLRSFEALAEAARACGKPIIAIKIGASDQAQAATVSHTASLAGSDAGARALLARLGVAQVSSLAALVEALKLAHVAGGLAGNQIASMSCSGGEASLMADMAAPAGLGFPPLNTRQITELRAALGPKVALANPLDYHTYIWGDTDALAATFTAMMDPVHALGIVVLDFPRGDRCSAADWDHVIDAVARARVACGRPMAVLASLPETMPEAIAMRLIALGVVPLSGMGEALEAIAAIAKAGGAGPGPAPLLLPATGTGAADGVLSEAAAKAALAGMGVTVPQSQTATEPDAAAQAAHRIGMPVVLKGEGIAHKTEAGAVRLNLATADAVQAAARAMPATRFLVEEMIDDGVAELLVGVVRDPAHGYVLTLAAGGTLTELLDDRVSLLVPSTEAAIAAALGQLRIAPILAGYRGAAAADMAAIVAAILAVQDYVAATHPAEIEINPLICTPTRAVAADALIRTGETDD